MLGHEIHRRDVGAEHVVPLKILDHDVVGMDVIAWQDIHAGETDDLVILADRLVLGDGLGGDLVPGGNFAIGRDRLASNLGALGYVVAGHDHIVIGMQADRG